MNSLKEIYESRVRRNGSGCWTFIGSNDGKGYTRIRLPGQKTWTRATHISWIVNRGEVPRGMFLLHKCDNPSCVNPDHLFLGNHLDNHRDSVNKGRHAFGERNGQSKITTATAIKIREYLEQGEFQNDIARELGVHRMIVTRIAGGYDWVHLGPAINYKRKPAWKCKLRLKFRPGQAYKTKGYLEKLQAEETGIPYVGRPRGRPRKTPKAGL